MNPNPSIWIERALWIMAGVLYTRLIYRGGWVKGLSIGWDKGISTYKEKVEEAVRKHLNSQKEPPK